MLYDTLIRLYGSAMGFASLFHTKAHKWVQGRQDVWEHTTRALQGNQKPVVWLHVASLGEFEQARPIIEGLRAEKGNRFFLLITFFSPSGYEVRKEYANADCVVYLPNDTKTNAKRWLELVRPSLVLWVKYEFWWNMLAQVQARQIPIVLFSATFRQGQFFFKPSARFFLQILRGFTQIFVQDAESLTLLKQHNFENVQIAGDTRFDRVLQTVAQVLPTTQMQTWQNDSPTLVLGSVWERDLEVVLPVLAKVLPAWKFIFAPHEIYESVLQKIADYFPNQTMRYSDFLAGKEGSSCRVLLVDSIGHLSALYQYASLAYVGGAFKEGLHNILEPTAFGVPVIFGRDYRKYPEAHALIEAGGAFSIQNSEAFEALITHLAQNEIARHTAGKQARAYIEASRGASSKILAYLQEIKWI